VICAADALRAIDLDACRPEPVSSVEKAAILQSLPAQGGVNQLSAGESDKLGAINRVLSAHARDGVYEVRVIAVPQAWTGLHGRAVLLISLPALNY
jgi:hypothetical protein